MIHSDAIRWEQIESDVIGWDQMGWMRKDQIRLDWMILGQMISTDFRLDQMLYKIWYNQIPSNKNIFDQMQLDEIKWDEMR